MSDKAKECFGPHFQMHALFGLGLGIVLANLVPVLNNVVLGVILMVAALGLDFMRKS